MTPDATSPTLAAFLAAHPVTLTDWERRTQERAFEVEPPEVDDWDPRGEMADAAAAAMYGGRDAD